jgi:tetratricopeptide (TPR) repeat protein
MIGAVTLTSRASRNAIAGCCLVGLALGLAAACVAPASWSGTPSPEPDVRLYTRTPTPTPIPATPTPTLSAQALYQQGLTQRVAWDLETALARFDAALALPLDPASATVGRSLAPIYASRAELYRLAGHYDEAAADIETALTLDPELAEAWQQKALLARAETAWDEALSAVNRLIQLRPDDGSAYVLRAQIYAQGFGKMRLALADYDRASARDPTFDKATLVERWQILATLKRWDEALLVSHKMFTSGSEDPARYYYRGWSLMQLGRLDDAIQMLFFGIKRYPGYPVALYYALGVTYYERHAWPEAIQALEVALAQSGASSQQEAAWQALGITSADVLGPLGVAYMELGQCETGAAIVERAVAESSDPAAWDWAVQRVAACYLSLTPTPTPTPAPTSIPQGEQVP